MHSFDRSMRSGGKLPADTLPPHAAAAFELLRPTQCLTFRPALHKVMRTSHPPIAMRPRA